MKMHSLKRWGCYCLLLVAIFSIFICLTEVNAKQQASGKNDDIACKNALFSGDILSVDNSSNSIKLNAKEGKWKIKYKIIENENSADYSFVLGETANPTLKDYVAGSTDNSIYVGPGNAIFIIAEPVGNKDGHILKTDGSVLKVSYTKSDGTTGTTTCKAGKVKTNKSNKLEIVNTAAYLSKAFKGSAKFDVKIDENTHPEAYKECKAMIEGKFNADDAATYLSSQADINKYNNQMKKTFPYCYGTYTSTFEISADTIKLVRQKSLAAFKVYLDFIAAEQNNAEYEAAKEEIKNDPSYKKIEYSSKGMTVEKLSCTKDQLTAKTEKFYTETEEVSNNVCSVSCQEQIQVTYDPPQTTKAGLCFQYKVTVKSKVTCKTDRKGEINWPTPPSICDYTPICGGDDQETQAGPTEEFDTCITECDGGKYTQSCINKCYKKVYGKATKTTNSTKKTAVSTKNNVTKLTNSTSKDPYYQIKGCGKGKKTTADRNAEIKKNVSTCAKEFYKLKQQLPMGKYIPDNSKSWFNYIWKPTPTENGDIGIDETSNQPSSDEWIESIKRSAPYYFRNAETAEKTIKSFYGVDSGTNGYGEARTYIIDNNGIKRQRSKSYNCQDVCGFISENNDTNCVNSDIELREYYAKALDGIEAKLSECTASAVCKEDEATFDMSVDNEAMKDKNTKDKSKWNATNKTNSDGKTCYNPDSSRDIKMFIPLNTDLETGTLDSECSLKPNGINGKCYGKYNSRYWQHYKTTITFPGTWIDLKTGRRVYQEEDANKDTMREKENYYCVGYDYESVNEQYWDWVYNQNSDLTKIDAVKIEDPDNITADITKFGKYNWNIKVNCFYALSKVVDPDDDSTSTVPYDECNNENSTELCNTEYRSVNQQNLFPAADGVNSRPAGFNWTNDATDLTAAGTSYGIKPGDYADELQDAAKANPDIAYTGTADYRVYLTKENIKNLREYVEENGYTSYQGNNKNASPEGVEGLYYYKSDILENNEFTLQSKFRRTATLGKNND